MELYPAGSITFVISENHEQDDLITEEDALLLAQSTSEYFKYQLSQKRLDKSIKVTAVDQFRGCVTIVISIGVAITAGGGFAAFEFLKNYKDIREGLDKLIDDMKNLKVWLKKKIFRKKTGKVEEKPEAPFEVLFEETIDQYKKLPPEQRKFWGAGQSVIIVGENDHFSKYTLSVKREDITLPEEKKPVKEKKKKESKKIEK